MNITKYNARALGRIVSFFKNHPNVLSLILSLALAISIYIGYAILADFYPPKTIGDYVIYIELTGNHYFVTHRYMFPTVYGSLIFLLSSLSYLRRKTLETFEGLKESIEDSEEISNKSIKLASSRYRYLFAFAVGFLLFFGIIIANWIIFGPYEIVYIDLPLATYMLLLYFAIACLSGLGLWVIFTSTYSISKVAGQQFRIDIGDPGQWIDDDIIGGFKQLSDFSLRIFGLLLLGVLFFSPAAILYHMIWYVAYVFALIPIGLFFLIITQQFFHKAIRRHKERFYELAKKKRDAGEITLAEYLMTLLAVKGIKDRPINLNILWGIFISSIVLPTLFWYVSLILREILGIVTP